MFDELKEVYKIDAKDAKPIRATGTRWIDHKLKSMSRLVSNFGVYTQHLQNVITDTSKKCDHRTVTWKYDKLAVTSVLVRYSLLIDILEPAQNVSLITQRNNLSIIDVVDAVEITKTKYPRLLKKLDEEENFIFTAFPTFKKIVKNIKEDENESGGIKVSGWKNKTLYTRKKYLLDNAAHIIKNIVERIEEHYSNVYNKDYTKTVENSKYVLSDEGDSLLLGICGILNSCCWPDINSGVADSLLKPQMKYFIASMQGILHFSNLIRITLKTVTSTSSSVLTNILILLK